ncbi:MazG-like family protein [Streptomyces sp. NPDC002734]|uniref:MazG-like family protein n=1 Tax=Streptomyces sp. NPDC002734 TaxID=3154426 RepID=UPI00331838EA
MWESVEDLWTWIDRNNTRPREQEVLLAVLKLSEEVGETAQAVIGAMGHNPRKGVTHDWEDVRAELCDVALSALIALRVLTPDASREFTAHVEGVRRRSAAVEAGKARPQEDA